MWRQFLEANCKVWDQSGLKPPLHIPKFLVRRLDFHAPIFKAFLTARLLSTRLQATNLEPIVSMLTKILINLLESAWRRAKWFDKLRLTTLSLNSEWLSPYLLSVVELREFLSINGKALILPVPLLVCSKNLFSRVALTNHFSLPTISQVS